jgi:hypothetical protein
MRLLERKGDGEISLTEFFDDKIPAYAILSHRWGPSGEEVTFKDLVDGTGGGKAGHSKIQFCARRAAIDGLLYFWIDTCCIDKSSSTELTEAINSMFHWYRDAAKCYVYLSDVSKSDHDEDDRSRSTWKSAFRNSSWFTRGWTLQELIAPRVVEFFSSDGQRLGDKISMEQQIHEITGISIKALRGCPVSTFSTAERRSWAAKRETTRKEDKAYCLLGIFDVHMPLIYGEGDKAFLRLDEEINKRTKASLPDLTHRGHFPAFGAGTGNENLCLDQLNLKGNIHWLVPRAVNTLFTGRADLLGRIHETFRSCSMSQLETQRRFVITGLGGQGKSEVCLKAANLMREE